MPSDKMHQAVCSHIVRLLREERLRQGLSIYAVAERSGLSQQMVSYVERGLRSPSLETTVRLVSALEVDFGDVFTRAQAATARKLSQ